MISVLAAKYFPGVDIPTRLVEAIFIAGATIAFAKAGLWLKGWQEYEKRSADTAPDCGRRIDLGTRRRRRRPIDEGPDMDAGPDLDDEPDLDEDPDAPTDEPDFDDEPDTGRGRARGVKAMTEPLKKGTLDLLSELDALDAREDHVFDDLLARGARMDELARTAAR